MSLGVVGSGGAVATSFWSFQIGMMTAPVAGMGVARFGDAGDQGRGDCLARHATQTIVPLPRKRSRPSMPNR
jgi:hypothetical protein